MNNNKHLLLIRKQSIIEINMFCFLIFLRVYIYYYFFIYGHFQPLLILDTISEHEKYGNNGDMFDGISRSLVNGYEAFSNFLNTIIQVSRI